MWQCDTFFFNLLSFILTVYHGRIGTSWLWIVTACKLSYFHHWKLSCFPRELLTYYIRKIWKYQRVNQKPQDKQYNDQMKRDNRINNDQLNTTQKTRDYFHHWKLSCFPRELLTLPEHPSSLPIFSGFHVAQSLVFCVVFSWSLFILLSLFIWSLYCLSCG
jgi:hypothetical protein